MTYVGGWMMASTETWLWRSALSDERPDASAEEQAFFRLHLESMRDRARSLVARISADMPGYTVHDETHLYALWETASLVASPDLVLNPPEAFVFGGAVLLHDAAMTLAAYPGGLSELRTTTAWADAAALHGAGQQAPDAEPSPLPPELELRIKSDVLRRLHAEKAKELATQGWQVRQDDDERMHLIENSDLRRFYGPSIGVVAHSHWWPIARVERELTRILGAMPPRTRHEVDLLKLALLLRVADALHLDRRRAPFFVRALERPQGSSALHWTFQERLAFPSIDDDAIIFTSGEAFEAKDAEAWWLAYDAFAMADRELRDSDLIFRGRGKIGLLARRVKGIGDPQELARHVPVSGWRPVETRVRVSDIPGIVENLGGDKLYGDDPTAPLRELLQNAMDALQARRRLQARPSDWGQIVVELAARGEDVWLSVEDTGVGMSEAVLVGPLLDFGSSFWRSPQIAEEFPGLAAKGMDAIGRFGIGFFSVFMLGDEVRVTTRRYDRAEHDTLVLEFRTGLHARPILSLAGAGVAPLDGGTRVEVKLRHDPRVKNGIQLSSKGSAKRSGTKLDLSWLEPKFSSLSALVGWLAPASDVSIATVEFGRRISCVSAGDWLRIPGSELAKRLVPARNHTDGDRTIVAACIRPIATSTGEILGRAALHPPMSYFWNDSGVLTAGGLRITGISHLLGVVLGEVATAARDKGRMLVPLDALSKWATEQAMLIQSAELTAEHKALCAELVLEYGGAIFDLPVTRRAGIWLNSEELKSALSAEAEIAVFVGEVSHEEYDPIIKPIFEQHFTHSDDVFFVPAIVGPHSRRSRLRQVIIAILEQAWGGYQEDSDDERIVGHADGEEIMRSVEIFHRPK